MTPLEYLCGLAILLLGFNIGYNEAQKGLDLKDFKAIFKKFLRRLNK